MCGLASACAMSSGRLPWAVAAASSFWKAAASLYDAVWWVTVARQPHLQRLEIGCRAVLQETGQGTGQREPRFSGLSSNEDFRFSPTLKASTSRRLLLALKGASVIAATQLSMTNAQSAVGAPGRPASAEATAACVHAGVPGPPSAALPRAECFHRSPAATGP